MSSPQMIRIGVGDVAGEPFDLLAAHGLLDQRAHDLHLSALGGSVYAGTIQPRSADSCQAMSDSSYDAWSPVSRNATSGSCSRSSPITSKRPAVAQVGRQRRGVLLHLLHHVGVAVAAEPDEVVVLRQHHRRARGEVQREGRVGLAEVVLVEDQVLGEVGLLAEDQPADARVDEAVLVPETLIDRTCSSRKSHCESG